MGLFNEKNNKDLIGTICFHGEVLDDRGEKALSLNEHNELYQFKYNDEEFTININDITYTYDSYLDFFKNISNSSIVIESTTLNVIDILFILKAIKHIPKIINIIILYIEPYEYNFKKSTLMEYDDFNLSSKLKDFPPVPGFTIYTRPYDEDEDEGEDEKDNTELIAFLGFERARLGQIFNADDGGTYSKFTPIIPLPGFRPGWENRTLNSHLKFFSSSYNFDKLLYVSANNPFQAYNILEEYSKTRKKFRVAPIGTKPNAIGCAIFLLNNDINNNIESGVLFDFPVKIHKRSSGIGKIHIYNLCKEDYD